ncbi:hypothetical protein ALP90_200185 [Pseudomonas amygdali pv. ulmi]|uniref:Transposase n=1 Tax=Pseudomonas amygdali pv. ulmi TaxID=251720 RepID=A0A3M4SPM9_PSEA0|nr:MULTISPECIES: ISL3 family transposase [Pseudomonas syringae group genomosp. 2]RMR16835.1 hypothetical protein ALP90_200185 [Pseudomonas amygdali pv. ulmi]RMU57711.1 hypothetical protein ALP27_200190 [Pseudomonas savastanoi pv. glycinea]
MPINILNLPDYKVVRVEENDHDYHITAEVFNPPTNCAGCDSDRLIGHGRNQQVIRDMPTHGKRVAIYVDTRRWRCVDCGKTFMEVMPAVNGKRNMTERLTRWIGQQSLKRTFASIAYDTGLDEKTIRNIFRDYVNVLEAEFRFETPKWLGIDEIYLIKPRGVITNIESNTVLDLLVNRNQDTIVKYLSGLKGKEYIQYVAMDMWKPYKTAVNAVLPHAIIVIDKFHIVKMANEALEKVRKSIRADLTLKQKRGLMHDRFLLLKREHHLTDKEAFILDGWVKNYPLLGEAYRLKEAFYEIYQAQSQHDALLAYELWRKSIPPELHDHFHALTRAFQNWLPEIMAYFKHPVTNAYTESINSLIRVMDRMGRGYSFEALRAKILFSEGAHKRTLSRPKFERRREPEVVETAIELPDDAIGYLPPAFMRKTIITEWKNKQIEGDPHEQAGSPRNYGADIHTLIDLLEAGML